MRVMSHGKILLHFTEVVDPTAVAFETLVHHVDVKRVLCVCTCVCVCVCVRTW